MRIQNNITAMNTHRQYTINNDNVAKAAEKLSSGYRINRAGDDAAGLAISEKMRSQIRGLNMATKNSQDAISLVQTAEGALQETQNMLQRMNELAVQAATGTNQEIDRNALAKEFDQLKREINDIAEQTTFNNMKVLDGSLSYKGYERSAATAGVNITRPLGVTVDEGDVKGSGTIKGATMSTGDAAPANDEKITLTATYTDEAGDSQDVKFTVTGDGTSTVEQLFAGGVEGDVKGWTAKVDEKTGEITLTSTKNMKADTTQTPTLTFTSDDNSNTSLPTISGTAAIEAVGATDKGDPSSVSATFGTLDGDPLTAGDKLSLEIEVTLADGKTKETLTFEGTAATGALKPSEILNSGLTTADSKGNTWSLTASDDGQDTTVTITGPAGVALDDTKTPTASLDTDKGGAVGTAIKNATVTAAVDDPGRAAEAEAADDTSSAAAAPTGVTTVEFDFVKLQDGDRIQMSVGDADIDITKTAGMTKDQFFKELKAQVEDAEGVELKGSAIVAKAGLEVSEVDFTDGLEDAETTAMRIQVGALENEQLNISIDSMNTAGLGLDKANLYSQELAGKAITAVRDAINQVSDQRATLGAMQNRLDHKIANLKVSSENLSAAESRIRDVDMAQEMTNFTKNNILSQAATAMLAQANSLPQNVLSLLG